MPGLSPHEAVQTFLAPFQENLAILDGQGQINVQRSGSYRTGQVYGWVLNGGDGMRLPNLGRFTASMRFEVIGIDPEKYDGALYRVTTRGYNYKLRRDDESADGWRFHWHPVGVSTHEDPHVHLPPNLDIARPTNRITFEFVLRWCIAEGAQLTCTQDEAERLLVATEWAHQLHRTWSISPSQPYAT